MIPNRTAWRATQRRNAFTANLVTAPAFEPVTLAQAKLFLRVDISDDDSLITNLLLQARADLENYTRRAFITQTWQMQFEFGPYMFEVARPPLQSVTSIVATAIDGTTSVVATNIYLVDTVSVPGRISLNTGEVYPTYPNQRGFAGFTVNYLAGWAAVASVPAPITQAILNYVSYSYLNRAGEHIPNEIYGSIDNYRILGPLQQRYDRLAGPFDGWW